MSKRLITTYQQKAFLNRQCMLFLKTFGMDNKMDPFVLSAEIKVDRTDVWQGYIRTMKLYIHKEQMHTKERVISNIDKLSGNMEKSVGYLDN